MENPLEYSPRVANETAVRLLKMGFAPQARRFLEREIPGKLGRERKLIRAQIALAENLPRQAEVDLLNIESVAANLLRAQARSQIGDHNAAATLYSSGGEKDEALRQAWFAEDWKRLKKTQDTAIADMAALVDLGLSEEGTEENLQTQVREQTRARSKLRTHSAKSGQPAIRSKHYCKKIHHLKSTVNQRKNSTKTRQGLPNLKNPEIEFSYWHQNVPTGEQMTLRVTIHLALEMQGLITGERGAGEIR